MKYILKPSLQHIAVVEIAVTLWNQNDVRALIEEYFGLSPFIASQYWSEVEDKVTEKVHQLHLPELLKKEIFGYIIPIGLQIFKWTQYHLPLLPCMIYSDHVILPSEFCWSSRGTIDWKKTAKVLIKSKNIGIFRCHKLARVYCLEDSILELENEVPGSLIESLSYENPTGNWENITFPCIRNERSFDSEGIFEYCAEIGNRVAAEYFFHKLTTSEKAASLISAARRVWDEGVMYFLLSQMDEEQQMEVFKSSPYEVLLCFLAWPLQSFFIEIANRLWEFMSDEDYYKTVIKIIDKIQDGYKDWNYQHLFRKVWGECPKAVKSRLIHEFHLLYYLLLSKDQENLKLVLQDATAVQKERFIYSGSVVDIFRKLICDNEWDLLECVIRECLPSKCKMANFKKHLKMGDARN